MDAVPAVWAFDVDGSLPQGLSALQNRCWAFKVPNSNLLHNGAGFILRESRY